MDLANVKENIITNVYFIDKDKNVPLHQHPEQDEVFYCIEGSGYGVLENDVIELTVGQTFVVPRKTMHSLRTDHEITVVSILIPIID